MRTVTLHFPTGDERRFDEGDALAALLHTVTGDRLAHYVFPDDASPDEPYYAMNYAMNFVVTRRDVVIKTQHDIDDVELHLHLTSPVT